MNTKIEWNSLKVVPMANYYVLDKPPLSCIQVQNGQFTADNVE